MGFPYICRPRICLEIDRGEGEGGVGGRVKENQSLLSEMGCKELVN